MAPSLLPACFGLAHDLERFGSLVHPAPASTLPDKELARLLEHSISEALS
jgi:hypothetical protein